MDNSRYSRQKDIIPRDKIEKCAATIIGVGAIGRQVALQLAAIGIPHLQLIDFDVVEESNVASQGYYFEDIGECKIEVTSDICGNINSDLEIDLLHNHFKRSDDINGIVFCCVDSISTRKHIWDAVKDKIDFFVDGRMSAEAMHIITVSSPESNDLYESTLFSQEEAYRGSCTAKSTIYCANVAAGFMLSQFTKWLRKFPMESDIQVNLLSSEINCGAV